MEKENKENSELSPQTFISPSSINTFAKCKRQYYYQYIEKLKQLPSIHLLKGTIVHSVLEDFFKVFDNDFRGRADTLFNGKLTSYKKPLNNLELSEEDMTMHIKDAKNMIDDFITGFEKKVNNILDIGIASGRKHAFHLLKPKFKEMFVKSEELHCRGYIDRIDKDFDGNITIGDYKTSKKYGICLNEDYKRQMAIYAVLYKEQEGIYPTYTSVIFLRYGETYPIEVTPSLMKGARDIIVDTYEKTRTTDIADYPKREQKLCSFCSFLDVCSGKKQAEEEKRMKKLKELMDKPEEKE